jgi:hypothetical protein
VCVVAGPSEGGRGRSDMCMQWQVILCKGACRGSPAGGRLAEGEDEADFGVVN